MPDFDRADLLEPEAIGEPGQRTFRLRVRKGREAASLWLEKEQLAALTLAIRQLLEQTSHTEPPAEPNPPIPSAAFPEQPQVDFKVGRLGIGYDERRRMVTILAYTLDDDEDGPPSFACQASRAQCRAFAEQAEEVISAGRPICLLCGGSIDQDGHKCLRRNGHDQQPLPEE
ncbi:MAG: hypothetical protein A2148_00735 [Chloroflexi bacterium RBG_16_68_14]|nr:MAG: hypothetical protein A2148_00735 [Chloroflexi bacterium RBG_16_68_14]